MSRGFLAKLFLLSTILIAPLWFALAFKWPISTDFIFYGLILKHFSAQFWSGELYPRWLMDVNAGFGSPVFLFYSPLSFYIGSFLEPFAGLDKSGFFRVLLSMSLALFTSGLSARRWLLCHFPKAEAEKGALLYAGCPYLLIHIYFTFGLAQLWAIALFPLLLWAAHDLTQNGWPAIPKLALAYALLALTHIPSLMVFCVIPLAWVFCFSSTRWRHSAMVMASGILGALLAAVYLLPMLANRPFISAAYFLEGKFNYGQNFLDIQTIAAGCLLLLPLIGYYIEIPGARTKRLNAQERFWMAIMAMLVFMALPISRPVWEILPFLHYLQFPVRFFAAAVPVVTILTLLWLVPARNAQPHWLTGMVWVVFAIISTNIVFFSGRDPVANILDNQAITAQEYATRWMTKEKIVAEKLPNALVAMPAAKIISGKGEANIIINAPRRIVLHAEVKQPVEIALRRFYFSGWMVDVPAATVRESSGLLAVTLPKGSHEVTLALPWFKGEREGLFISLAALAMWGALFLVARRQNKICA